MDHQSAKESKQEVILSLLPSGIPPCMEHFFASNMDAIIISDKDFQLIGFNPVAERLFLYKKHEVIGKSINILLPHSFRSQHNAQMEGFAKSAATKRKMAGDKTLFGLKSTGEKFPLEAAITTMIDENGNKLFIATIRDLTEKINDRKELERLNKELETFMYRSSHDIKGPLASIIGLVNIAKMDVEDAQGLKYLGMIQERAHSLMSSLQKLIKVTTIMQGKLEYENISVNQTLRESLAKLEFVPERENLMIMTDIEDNDYIITDRSLLETILCHLLDNALKYKGRKLPYIKIIGNKENEEYKLSIVDNGQGIHPSLQMRVFDMFYRGNENSNGAGLGLYIVKNAVEKLQGRISMQSTPGRGTTIDIYLPLPKFSSEKNSLKEIQAKLISM